MARKAAEQNDDNDENAHGGASKDTQPAIIPSRIIVSAGFHILFCLKFSPDKNVNTYHHCNLHLEHIINTCIPYMPTGNCSVQFANF